MDLLASYTAHSEVNPLPVMKLLEIVARLFDSCTVQGQVRRTPDQCSRQKVEINAHVHGILIGLQRYWPLTRVRRLLPAPM